MICLTGRTSSEVVALLEEWLAADDDERLVVETSGSTGAPKRVVLARDAVMAGAAATAERLGGAGPWLLALPPGYVAGAMVVIRSLLAGHHPTVVGGPCHQAIGDAAVGRRGWQCLERLEERRRAQVARGIAAQPLEAEGGGVEASGDLAEQLRLRGLGAVVHGAR